MIQEDQQKNNNQKSGSAESNINEETDITMKKFSRKNRGTRLKILSEEEVKHDNEIYNQLFGEENNEDEEYNIKDDEDEADSFDSDFFNEEEESEEEEDSFDEDKENRKRKIHMDKMKFEKEAMKRRDEKRKVRRKLDHEDTEGRNTVGTLGKRDQNRARIKLKPKINEVNNAIGVLHNSSSNSNLYSNKFKVVIPKEAFINGGNEEVIMPIKIVNHQDSRYAEHSGKILNQNDGGLVNQGDIYNSYSEQKLQNNTQRCSFSELVNLIANNDKQPYPPIISPFFQPTSENQKAIKLSSSLLRTQVEFNDSIENKEIITQITFNNDFSSLFIPKKSLGIYDNNNCVYELDVEKSNHKRILLNKITQSTAGSTIAKKNNNITVIDLIASENANKEEKSQENSKLVNKLRQRTSKVNYSELRQQKLETEKEKDRSKNIDKTELEEKKRLARLRYKMKKEPSAIFFLTENLIVLQKKYLAPYFNNNYADYSNTNNNNSIINTGKNIFKFRIPNDDILQQNNQNKESNYTQNNSSSRSSSSSSDAEDYYDSSIEEITKQIDRQQAREIKKAYKTQLKSTAQMRVDGSMRSLSKIKLEEDENEQEKNNRPRKRSNKYMLIEEDDFNNHNEETINQEEAENQVNQFEIKGKQQQFTSKKRKKVLKERFTEYMTSQTNRKKYTKHNNAQISNFNRNNNNNLLLSMESSKRNTRGSLQKEEEESKNNNDLVLNENSEMNNNEFNLGGEEDSNGRSKDKARKHYDKQNPAKKSLIKPNLVKGSDPRKPGKSVSFAIEDLKDPFNNPLINKEITNSNNNINNQNNYFSLQYQPPLHYQQQQIKSQKELLYEAIFTEIFNNQSLEELRRIEEVNKRELPSLSKKKFQEYVKVRVNADGEKKGNLYIYIY